MKPKRGASVAGFLEQNKTKQKWEEGQWVLGM